jgi:hypothetical protein
VRLSLSSKKGDSDFNDGDTDDSKFGGLTAIELCQGFGRQLVELASFRICLDLAIPSFPVVRGEPRAESRQLFGREVLNTRLSASTLVITLG